jgi:hypothetical protein
MDKPKVTPKDFFLWAFAMISFYWSVISLIALLFKYIEHAFPDSLDSYTDPYSSSMRFSMASLIVFFPLYLYIMRVIRKDIAHDPSRNDIWVRRWLIVLTIFVAGLTVAGDLVTLINYFLGGDLTARFLLKVAIIVLVAAGVLMHFLADMWGYWKEFPERARYVGWAVAVLLLATIGCGFLILGTPGQVRLYRFDDQKVQDLTNIQYQIVNFWQQKQKLPASLSDLADPLSGNTIPIDTQNNQPYKYSVKGTTSFELCAIFNAETQQNSESNMGRSYPVVAPTTPGGSSVSGVDLYSLPWTHGSGETCFTRTIDPERYPPFNKGPNPVKPAN